MVVEGMFSAEGTVDTTATDMARRKEEEEKEKATCRGAGEKRVWMLVFGIKVSVVMVWRGKNIGSLGLGCSSGREIVRGKRRSRTAVR